MSPARGASPAAIIRIAGTTFCEQAGSTLRRFDESTATILEQSAAFARDEYRGDLRWLGQRAEQNPKRASELLTAIAGIGPAGADIFLREAQRFLREAQRFLREAQRVWGWLQPYLDDGVAAGAQRLGLPHSRSGLTRMFARAEDPAALAAALVRATIDDEVVRAVLERVAS